MEFYKGRYYRLCRSLLLLVGQWPFDQSKLKYLSRFVFLTTIVSFGLAEVFKIITMRGQSDILMQMLPLILFSMMTTVKYLTCWINNGFIKKMLEFIQSDWKSLQSDGELEVIKTYVAEGCLYGQIFTVYIFTVTLGMVLLLFVPFVLDICMPLNVSRAEALPFDAEYFVDMQDHYYIIILHFQGLCLAGIAVTAAADVLFISIVFYACGMQSLLRYRLEHMFDDIEQICVARRVSVFRRKIMYVVKRHLKCIEYLQLSTSCYVVSYVLQYFIVVLSIASLLYNVHSLLMSEENLMAAVFVFDLLGHYLVLFLNIMPGQRLVDCSSEIYYYTYSGSWYKAPLTTQKLLLFLMQNTRKPCILTAAGLIDISIESFSMIVRVSFSYFMMLRSLRE